MSLKPSGHHVTIDTMSSLPPAVDYQYRSLEDLLIANPLTVDGQSGDGWGGRFPVKGREIEATVLFADISNFSGRTADMTPTETLAFVNHFFCWIDAQATRYSRGIIDKYIGDEIMIVFSTEFGSKDPFAEAVKVAHAMCDNDYYAFMPHIGIASGPVLVGYVGTPLKYNCSVFGAPVAMAARCAATKPEYDGTYSCSMAFPASEWTGRSLDGLMPVPKGPNGRGDIVAGIQKWQELPPRPVEFKNMGSVEVQHLVDKSFRAVTIGDGAEQTARKLIAHLTQQRRCVEPRSRAASAPSARPSNAHP